MKMREAPQTIEEFQVRFSEISGSLPKRLRQCADYIAINEDKIAVSTVAELAVAAGVQPSAFMRFCQLMGFSGYSEMQRLFRGAWGQRWPDYATRLKNLKSEGAGSPTALLAEFVEAGRVSLETLAGTVDSEALKCSVEVLANAPMIHLLGLKRAFPVASYLAYAFEEMNIPALLHDCVGMLDHRNAIRRGDVLIAVTFAPYSSETLDLAQFARERDCPIVAITDSTNSPLRKIGAHILSVSEVDFGSFRGLSATLSLAITLAVSVGSRR
ncbi:MAG: RpiR family transcriptional regulator [Hyphomicrobiales bacterium]|nr:MAG: RpiR family transcriptional regulator [Hyphomicrobiales bacterium]